MTQSNTTPFCIPANGNLEIQVISTLVLKPCGSAAGSAAGCVEVPMCPSPATSNPQMPQAGQPDGQPAVSAENTRGSGAGEIPAPGQNGGNGGRVTDDAATGSVGTAPGTTTVSPPAAAPVDPDAPSAGTAPDIPVINPSDIGPINPDAPYSDLEKSWMEARGYDVRSAELAALPGKLTNSLTKSILSDALGLAIDFVGLRNDPGLILANSDGVNGLFIGFREDGQFVIRTKSAKGIYPSGTSDKTDIAIFDGNQIQGDGTLLIWIPPAGSRYWPRVFWQGRAVLPVETKIYGRSANKSRGQNAAAEPLVYLADTAGNNVPEGLPFNAAAFTSASGLRGYVSALDIWNLPSYASAENTMNAGLTEPAAPYSDLEKSWTGSVYKQYTALAGQTTTQANSSHAYSDAFAMDFVGLRNDPGLILANSDSRNGLFIGYREDGNFVISKGVSASKEIAVYDGKKIQGDGTLIIFLPSQQQDKNIWPRVYWNGDHIAPIEIVWSSQGSKSYADLKPLIYLSDTSADNVPGGLPVTSANYAFVSGLRGYRKHDESVVDYQWGLMV